MLITQDLVFIHMPKTGGTFLRRFLEPVYEGNPHATAAEIPTEFADLPVFSVIRNPWDWYVSWFEFQSTLPGGNDMWELFSDGGQLGFHETVRRACGDIDSDHPMVAAMDHTGFDYLTLLWTATVERYDEVTGLFEPLSVEVGRFERLREDFAWFLARHEIVVPEGLYRAPTVNSSIRGDYRGYYDRGLRDLVGEKTHRLIRAYGYTF